MQHLLHAVLREPEAALDHLRAYGRLARVELALLLRAWQRRTLMAAGALVLAGLGAGFSGLVLMAWALVPATLAPLSQAQWLLLCTPAAASWLGSLACLVALRRHPLPDPLEQLARQWQLDAGWLLPVRQDPP